MASDPTDLRSDLAAALDELLGGDGSDVSGRPGSSRLTVNVREDRLGERPPLAASTRPPLAASSGSAPARVSLRDDRDLPPIRAARKPTSLSELIRQELPNGTAWYAGWIALRELAIVSMLGWVVLIALSLWQPSPELEIGSGSVPVWQLALSLAVVLRALVALSSWALRSPRP